MDFNAARTLVEEINASDSGGRVARLLELSEMLPSEGLIGFEGSAGQFLFEDVKATWLYGCFTSTVLTANAFCVQQLAGSIRWLPEDSSLPEQAGSPDELAELAAERGVITVDLQGQLVQLNDRFMYYAGTSLHEAPLQLERHLLEAEAFGEVDHPLLADARLALTCAIALVHRRT